MSYIMNDCNAFCIAFISLKLLLSKILWFSHFVGEPNYWSVGFTQEIAIVGHFWIFPYCFFSCYIYTWFWRTAMQETWVWSLGWEDPLEKGMATHSSILAWRIPWTEEPGGLHSTGSQRVGHDWATSLSLSFTFEGLLILWLQVISTQSLCTQNDTYCTTKPEILPTVNPWSCLPPNPFISTMAFSLHTQQILKVICL